ncbi:MAG TPA: antibiotic biosynthesis monooxygenase [Mycobacteriales bacterium]|nr:antibiotic biosynthesis monooxygenase [Mycobacteriales bacterium]
MWIQMIKARLKTGTEEQFAAFEEQIRAIEQPGSGWIRSTAARAQKDPDTVYIIVAFESEAAARARESDPRRQEGLVKVRELIGEIFDGPPEFIDLDVISEHTP